MRVRYGVLCVLLCVTSPVFSAEREPRHSDGGVHGLAPQFIAGLLVYPDRPFSQDFAEKIPLSEELSGTKLIKVRSDRNGRILVLSEAGLLQAESGKLIADRQYRPMLDMKIKDLDTFDNQFVYLTDKIVFSNAWAGRFSVPHQMHEAKLFKMAGDSDFLFAAEDSIAYFRQGKCTERQQVKQIQIKQLFFDREHKRFLLLSDRRLDSFLPSKEVATVFKGPSLNCLELTSDGRILVGTTDGYIELDAESFRHEAAPQTKLPWTDIRCIKQIGDKIWFGTPKGAFALHDDGQIDYYASKRWLVDDNVVDICEGPDGSVLILSQLGLSIIHFKMMTLQEKAAHFDRLTRQRHVRYGLNSTLVMDKPGDLSTGTLVDEDNDGLWTAMYLAGELFRYAVTKSDQALQNCYESFEAMERLEQINPLDGFPARSFERSGYQMADKPRWHSSEDGNWTWKGTTSSDEIVGHFFAYTIFAEIVPDEKWRQRAISLMDRIMSHIVRNNLYLVDYDGKPTLWGKWNPDYVNQFPPEVGDRRLNSIEIISFLQAAYHFTGKQIYKDKALELLQKHGYLENIMIPVTKLARVPGIDLTTEWNHSDDELAFLSYWNLYKYAFSEDLREKYRQTIKGHWQIERPEKNPLWNFIYAATGVTDGSTTRFAPAFTRGVAPARTGRAKPTRSGSFDLDESIWTLKKFPLDTIGWTIKNSHRKDLDFLEPNFRQQTTQRVLSPDERPMSKHNNNAFDLDGGDNGRQEYSGDIFLLPYWMGRYLKIIQ